MKTFGCALVSSVFVSLFSLTAPTKANDCTQYADRASNAVDFIRARRCDYVGARWSADVHEHRLWCGRVSAAESQVEDRERQRGVYCCNYATATTRQVLDAANLHCGYDGARWSSNIMLHANWCLGAGDGLPESERRERDAGLASCRAQPKR
jgi:hypothetical protein